MKRKILFYCFAAAIAVFIFSQNSFSQNVGIGTTTPNAKAALEVKSTDKGILFPRLTSAQRNAITNPPDGLHVYNTDEHCLNVFDSANQIWNCYCFDCQTVIINITSNACKIDFYNAYAKNAPAKKYVINISAGVIISGCGVGDTALSFSSMPFNAVITINNNGIIAGAGGKGGNGNKGFNNISCVNMVVNADPGQIGGAAISTKSGILITINNSGTIAGGGGGGGGGGGVGASGGTFAGGGGGGGAGIASGTGGNAGGFLGGGTCIYDSQGTTNGQPGTNTGGGSGGSGGTTGNGGGIGGIRSQAGGTGTGLGAGTGGAGGKAISGGSGNNITNIGGGQSFGIVD
jgi:uncharacterized membrane protein YgcG